MENKTEIITKPVQTLSVSFFDTDGLVKDIIVEKYKQLKDENERLKKELEETKQFLENSKKRTTHYKNLYEKNK